MDNSEPHLEKNRRGLLHTSEISRRWDNIPLLNGRYCEIRFHVENCPLIKRPFSGIAVSQFGCMDGILDNTISKANIRS